MLRRGRAVLSVGCDARAFQPSFALWLLLATPAGERFFDQIETLVEAIATHRRIMWCRPDAVYGIVILQHILPAHGERIDAEFATQFVHGAFNGKRGLRGAISPECSRRNRIRIDCIPNALLVRAPIGGHSGTKRRGQYFAGVIAVGAGIGNVAYLHRRERSTLFRAELDSNLHWMPADGGREFLRARKFPLHRTPGL